jgi:hypothetical protein
MNKGNKKFVLHLVTSLNATRDYQFLNRGNCYLELIISSVVENVNDLFRSGNVLLRISKPGSSDVQLQGFDGIK